MMAATTPRPMILRRLAGWGPGAAGRAMTNHRSGGDGGARGSTSRRRAATCWATAVCFDVVDAPFRIAVDGSFVVLDEVDAGTTSRREPRFSPRSRDGVRVTMTAGEGGRYALPGRLV